MWGGRGRVNIGERQLLNSINVAFNKPIVEAIEAVTATAKESGNKNSPNIIENRKLLDRLCWGIEQAAGFGIFTDQPLVHNRTKHPVGFLQVLSQRRKQNQPLQATR